MELVEFVAASLLQITNGVHQAQEELASSGIRACVNPWADAAQKISMVIYNGSAVQNIEFDVAVVVTEERQSSVGGKVSVAVAGLGTEKQESGQTSALHRIRFKVPVAFPVDRL